MLFAAETYMYFLQLKFGDIYSLLLEKSVMKCIVDHYVRLVLFECVYH